MRTPKRTVLLRFVLVLASISVGLLMAEGIVRLVAPQGMTVPWADEVNGVLAPRPNVRGREFIPDTYDVTISFNAQRFRGQKPYALEPAPGVIRIAALGDSFTFGSGANDDETYPHQLQSILQEWSQRSGSHFTYEVINAGIGGTGTAEQALWYDNWVKRFHPHLVILNVICNDVDPATGLFLIDKDGKAVARPSNELEAATQRFRTIRKLVGGLPGYGFLAQHSELLNLLRIEVGAAIARSRVAALEKESAPSQLMSEAEQFQKVGLPLMAGEVRWLEERVLASEAHLAIVFIPCRETVYPSQAWWAEQVRQQSPAIIGILHDVTSEKGIPFNDVTPAIRRRAGGSDRPLYYNGRYDTHPTPAGYRAIAEAVANFLLERQLVPSDLAATLR